MREPRRPTPPVFTVTADGGAGLTRRQAQATGFSTPSRGIRVRIGPDLDPTDHLRAISSVSSPDAVLTDLTAARLWHLPVSTSHAGDATAVVSVPAGAAHARRRGVRGRRVLLPDDHVTTLDGLRVTTPERTWLDCSASLSLADLVAMGDTILRRGLATEQSLARMCHWGFRRRGLATARRALTLLDADSESPGESWTRVALVTGGIRRPRCNVDVVVAGTWLARVDLLWEPERVVVEYDGHVHLPEGRRRKDALRRNLLQEGRYDVLVFTAADLRHPERMCALVRSALRRAPLR